MAEAGRIIYGALVVVLALVVVYWFFAWMTSGYSHETEVSSADNQTVVNMSEMSDVPQANFMITVWFYISEWTRTSSDNGNGKGLLMMTNATNTKTITGQPLLVTFGDTTNNLKLTLRSDAGVGEGSSGTKEIKIENIPVQRWTCLSVSVNGRTVDVYLNGKLVSTAVMQGPFSKPNSKGKLVVAPRAGKQLASFEGFTSYLMYSPEPINPQQAWEIYRDGFGGSSSLTSYGLRVQIMKDGKATSSLTV